MLRALKHLFHKPSKSTMVSKTIGSSSEGISDITSYVFKCDLCGHTWTNWVWGTEKKQNKKS